MLECVLADIMDPGAPVVAACCNCKASQASVALVLMLLSAFSTPMLV